MRSVRGADITGLLSPAAGVDGAAVVVPAISGGAGWPIAAA